MSEVHRYRVVKMFSEAGNLIRYEPHGPWVVPAEHYDTAQSQLAALREELAIVNREKNDVAYRGNETAEKLNSMTISKATMRNQLKQKLASTQQRLADAERRNAVLTEALAAEQAIKEPAGEDSLWQVLDAAVGFLTRRAAPHAWESEAFEAGRKIIIARREGLTATAALNKPEEAKS